MYDFGRVLLACLSILTVKKMIQTLSMFYYVKENYTKFKERYNVQIRVAANIIFVNRICVWSSGSRH